MKSCIANRILKNSILVFVLAMSMQYVSAQQVDSLQTEILPSPGPFKSEIALVLNAYVSSTNSIAALHVELGTFDGGGDITDSIFAVATLQQETDPVTNATYYSIPLGHHELVPAFAQVRIEYTGGGTSAVKKKQLVL